jgi:hypothetical protein
MPCTKEIWWERQVLARYLDACARGLRRDAAIREAAALISVLCSSLSPRDADEIARGILATMAE